jgi:hypothetical protein
MTRPGATQCQRCHVTEPYDVLHYVVIRGRLARSWLCDGCFDRLGRLGLLK